MEKRNFYRANLRQWLLRGTIPWAGLLLGMNLLFWLPPGSVNSLAAQGSKQTLTVAFPSNPETIDPHQTRSVLTASILWLMEEGLLTRDPDTMEIKPLLALSYRNIDPHTWEFTLRQGVKFHNGEDFNAESVKFSIERNIDSKLSTSGKTQLPVEIGPKVQIIDPYKVRITTKIPDPLLANRMASEPLSMVPPKALAAFKDRYVTDKMIGTGPFKFVEFVVGDRVVMEANPNYWGPKPPTQRIVFQVIPDEATRVAALQRGSVDFIINLPLPLVPAVKSDPNLQVYSKLGSTVHHIFFNSNEVAPLKDRRVRQALNCAVDREAILKNLYQGYGKLVNGVDAQQVTNAIDPGAYPYDPAKARQLRAEAGYPNGFQLTLWQAIGRWSQAEDVAQLIAGYFDKIGVKTNLMTLDFGEYNARASLSKFKDAFYYAFTNLLWDTSAQSQRFLPTYPRYRYYDAQGDLRKTIAEYEETFDPVKRKEMAARIQKELHDEAIWLFLYQLDELFGMNKKVKNFKMSPDQMLRFHDTYVEQ